MKQNNKAKRLRDFTIAKLKDQLFYGEQQRKGQ